MNSSFQIDKHLNYNITIHDELKEIDCIIFMSFFLTKSVKTGNGNFSILCHSYRTNRVTDPFSISK